MAYEMKDGSGSLFVNNEQQRTSENFPHYSGSVKLNGVEYWLSGWKKQTKAGAPYLSLSIKPKEPKREKPEAQPKAAPADFNDDTDIPF